MALRATTLLWYLNFRALAQLAQSLLQGPGQLLHWVCPPKSVSKPASVSKGVHTDAGEAVQAATERERNKLD